MKLQIKDLSSKKLELEVDPSTTIAQVKASIEEKDASMVVDRQRLIHKGRVLRDEDTVESTGVTESEFFVCMVSKPKAAPRAPAPAPAPAPVPAPSTSAPAPAPASAPAPGPALGANLDPGQVNFLVELGFSEANARAALQATGGNPDAAYALLESGMPIPSMAPAPTGGASTSTGTAQAAPVGSITTLEAFRAHPQFNELRRVVQSNPASLDQVLQLIGQQSPQLLRVIMERQDEFLAMMNEPIEEGTGTGAGAGAGTGATGAAMGLAGLGGMDALGLEGLDGGQGGPSPQQLAQMLQAMPEAQRNQLLASITGLPPDQVGQFSQQLIQTLANGAAQGMPGMGAVMPQAQHRIQLTEEEAANLNRLVEMGFDRTEALQVFLACGKNVDVAASILFDNMAEDRTGGPSGGPGRRGGDDAGPGSTGGDDEQMY